MALAANNQPVPVRRGRLVVRAAVRAARTPAEAFAGGQAAKVAWVVGVMVFPLVSRALGLVVSF